MDLELLSESFAVCQIPDLSQVNLKTAYLFLAQTDEELSLVCPADCVPANAAAVASGWRAFRVAGPLDFGLVGILAQLTAALAAADVSIFAISTYNTDYILVKETNLEPARRALADAGWLLR